MAGNSPKTILEEKEARITETIQEFEQEVKKATIKAKEEPTHPRGIPKERQRVCPNCATTNDSDANFCKKCGHKLN